MSHVETRTQNEILARSLARELTHLRPSQMRELSSSITGPAAIRVFFRAIEIALEQLNNIDQETIERVYLFGLEVRQMLEQSEFDRFYKKGIEGLVIEGYTTWSAVWPVAKLAFLGGLKRMSFRQVRKEIDDSAEVQTIVQPPKSFGPFRRPETPVPPVATSGYARAAASDEPSPEELPQGLAEWLKVMD